MSDILRVPQVDLDYRYPKYHNFSRVYQSLYMLEIPQVLKRVENLWYIADTCNSTPRTGIDDITSFFGPSKLLVCWRYIRF